MLACSLFVKAEYHQSWLAHSFSTSPKLAAAWDAPVGCMERRDWRYNLTYVQDDNAGGTTAEFLRGSNVDSHNLESSAKSQPD